MQEMQERMVQSMGQEDPLEKGMATLSSILAWRIQWTEEPGRLQSNGLQTVGHAGVTKPKNRIKIKFSDYYDLFEFYLFLFRSNKFWIYICNQRMC